MSAKIGQNFSYLGRNFLDNRQGIPKTEGDLKSWTLPVPIGFEVCIGTTWYYYDPGKTTENTGHWIPRVCTDLDTGFNNQAVSKLALQNELNKSKAEIVDLKKKLSELEGALFPVSFGKLIISPAWTKKDLPGFEQEKSKLVEECGKSTDLSNDFNGDGKVSEEDVEKLKELLGSWQKYDLPQGTSSVYSLDVGSSIIPRITWKLRRKGKNVETINCEVSGGSKTGRISGEKESYLDLTEYKSDEPSTKSFTVTAFSDDNSFVEGKVDIMFKYRTYYSAGIDSFLKESYDEKQDLQEFKSFLTDSGALPRSLFDCTGGKYPYIFIPAIHYRANLKILVNDLLNSDFDVFDCTIKNVNGISIPYKILRTSLIQTGNPIPIQINL